MKIVTLYSGLVFSTALSFGQNNDLPQREPFTLTIAVDDTNFYKSEIKASAFVLPDNTIQLYPGETIYAEVELVKNKIKSIKTVKENLNPAKTITISFSQQADGKEHKGMMLKIKNPFNLDLEYKANIFLMEPNQWVMTNVLPVRAKLTSYETWPDIIVTIALSGWTFK